MEAGRELDAQVAEIMGWKWYSTNTRAMMYAPSPSRAILVKEFELWEGKRTDVRVDMTAHPHYSIDIAAAWEVWTWAIDNLTVTECNCENVKHRVPGRNKFFDELYTSLGISARAMNLCRITPLAICHAVLKAVGESEKASDES